jgi:AcrR family transcriptional regulator
MQDRELPEAPAKAPAGRPRDPGLDARVFDAAIAIYADGGWSALTFDAVARAAGVGKGALYRRWGDRAALLNETLHARWYAVGAIDTGTLRGDLLALARMCLNALAGPHGETALHLRADAKHFRAARASTGPYGEQMVAQARKIIRRAIARGELPAETKPGLILDLVVGGVTNHVASTPRRLRKAMVAQADQFTIDLVDLVLCGAVGVGRGPAR